MMANPAVAPIAVTAIVTGVPIGTIIALLAAVTNIVGAVATITILIILMLVVVLRLDVPVSTSVGTVELLVQPLVFVPG
jgi:hypothetical protein